MTVGGPLEGVRVLDLATSRAELAGRTLAELGADVVKIEPPGGAEARRRPPFAPDGASLYWATVGMGKRSLIVDLSTTAGRERVGALAEEVDVLVESFDPGVMDGYGLGYLDLAAANPGLVYASVTPYGQDGPKASWPATDLTIEAASGRLGAQNDGDRTRPPVPVGYPQASFHAGVQAADDVVIALNERAVSGRGQYLDTSMQAVMVWTLMAAVSGVLLDDEPHEPDPAKVAARLAQTDLLPGIWACKDGFVAAPLLNGAVPLLRHIVGDRLEYDWSRLIADVLRDRVDSDFVRSATAMMAEFFSTRTKRELFDLAFTGDFRLGPLMTTRDLLDDAHLAARDYWRSVGGRTHPGPAVRLSGHDPVLPDPAPELDSAAPAQPAFPQFHRPQQPEVGESEEREAFAGLKVADFSWVAVGPTIGRALADHGATVVRVESRKRLDVARSLAPWKGDQRGLDDSGWYAHHNASKLSLTLDLQSEEGRATARELVAWADVVLESFSPGTMARFGLDYETLRADRPDLIMLSTSLLGQTGPLSSFAGFGQQGVGLSGISTITGWPDRNPSPPMGAYTDVIAPKYGIAALGAAILERRRTGRGQYLDLAQVEASIRFIEPLVLDDSVNGRVGERPGLASDVADPHGVYEASSDGSSGSGRKRFVAVACETDEQREALASVLDGAELADWIAARPPSGAVEELVTAGVPAAVVATFLEVGNDEQLRHRQFFVPLDHPAMGRCEYEGLTTRFSAKPRQVQRPAPTLGQHTDEVARDLLGLDEGEIARRRAAGGLD
jgi:crotonobetainyl-CoA:carnitine CoA-transferase CaiB-like acyl-CoA transferase